MLYASDDGRDYATKVDAAYVVMADRGWLVQAQPGDAQYPRGWRLRRAVGLSVAGDLVYADCASTGAALWTGAVSSFEYINQSGEHVTANVIARQRERRLLIPAAAGP